MTAQDKMVMAEALVRLATARGSSVDDTTVEVYLPALADLEPSLVARACAELARLPRQDYETALPSVGTIREACQATAARDTAEAAMRNLLPMPQSDEDGPTYFCLDCRDESSAWRLFWCKGAGPDRALIQPARYRDLTHNSCGRTTNHATHVYGDRCACRDTNPVIAERRAKESRPTYQPRGRR